MPVKIFNNHLLSDDSDDEEFPERELNHESGFQDYDHGPHVRSPHVRSPLVRSHLVRSPHIRSPHDRSLHDRSLCV
ncbi:hypothetical protein Pmani_000675 [Petrolisthes manimaculis]|uniref:Uncharacterized protein n=1 Tax=Petrolisthes manimaculis TaxID=1843537 RepID=A0AAE1USF0_9EUCA|nr:hypothetical protein Pmani_000675 [Petrolisthes manimaculis]